MSAPVIGLIVTGTDCFRDFKIFVKTLEQWHPDATLYVFTDTKTQPESVEHSCKIITKVCLDAYTGKSRKIMEKTKGKVYDSMWKEFMYEKANILRWIFELKPSLKDTGVWLMDTDIIHLAPLPEIPAGKTLALCPHYINSNDENLYGHYNGGYLWLKDPSLLDVWCEAGKTSRFFEQSALEDIAEKAKDTLYEFPIQVNFGWWRMFQGTEDKKVIQTKFSIFRTDNSVGIRYDGAPLQSIHTHAFDKTPGACAFFNIWFTMWLNKVANAHQPLADWKRIVYG